MKDRVRSIRSAVVRTAIPPSPTRLISDLPAELAGASGYSVVQVQFFGPKFVLTQQQADGTWLAADIYCQAYAGDPDPYSNRSTVSRAPCSA